MNLQPWTDDGLNGAVLDPARCPACHEPVEARWAFCEWCAADLGGGPPTGSTVAIAAAEPAVPVLAGSVPVQVIPALPAFAARRRRRLPGRQAVTLVSALLAICLVVAGVLAHLDTLRTLDRTQAGLGTARAELADTGKLLLDSETALAAVRTNLTGEIVRRESAERDLAGVRGTVEDQDTRLSLQTGQLETLKTCLKGVSVALRAVAYDDYSAAIAALDSVDTACEKAGELF